RKLLSKPWGLRDRQGCLLMNSCGVAAPAHGGTLSPVEGSAEHCSSPCHNKPRFLCDVERVFDLKAEMCFDLRRPKIRATTGSGPDTSITGGANMKATGRGGKWIEIK